LRRYTPRTLSGIEPSTSRSPISHSPTTGAKLPIRGGFVDFDAHSGGAESVAKTSSDASSSSVSLRWTTRGRARGGAVVPPAAPEARGSVARPRRERRDEPSQRVGATPTGCDIGIATPRGRGRDPRRRADLGRARGGDTRARPRTRGRSGCVRSGMSPSRVFVETTSTYLLHQHRRVFLRVPARSSRRSASGFDFRVETERKSANRRASVFEERKFSFGFRLYRTSAYEQTVQKKKAKFSFGFRL
jgi:hypothetical protein